MSGLRSRQDAFFVKGASHLSHYNSREKDASLRTGKPNRDHESRTGAGPRAEGEQEGVNWPRASELQMGWGRGREAKAWAAYEEAAQGQENTSVSFERKRAFQRELERSSSSSSSTPSPSVSRAFLESAFQSAASSSSSSSVASVRGLFLRRQTSPVWVSPGQPRRQ